MSKKPVVGLKTLLSALGIAGFTSPGKTVMVLQVHLCSHDDPCDGNGSNSQSRRDCHSGSWDDNSDDYRTSKGIDMATLRCT